MNDKSPAVSKFKSVIGTSRYPKTGKAVRNTNSTIKTLIEPKEVITTKKPYYDKNYSKVYNPAANEVGFLGGLGKSTGHARSKVHITRPTMTQILLKMRTSNRILVSFGEELNTVHSLTKRQLQTSPKNKRKSIKEIQKEIEKKIIDVRMADNVDITPTKGSSSDSFVAKSATPTTIEAQETEKSKKPVEYYHIKKLDIETYKPPKLDEDSFRNWALTERDKRNQVLQQASFQQSKQEREMNQLFPKIREPITKKLKQQKKKKNPLSGYLYGSFTKSLEFDHAMNKQTKFGVPLSMFTRAKLDAEIKGVYRKKMQLSRLEYMKIPIIPSDSDSDGDQKVDIKSIGFSKTPFNTIVPKVTMKRVKKIERLRNKYLKGNRLKRVGLLLFDRTTPAMCDSESETTAKPEDGPSSRRASGQLSNCSDGSDQELEEIPETNEEYSSVYRKEFRQFLGNKYLEKLQQYNDKLNQKLISFEAFRESEMTSSAAATTIKPSSYFERKSYREISSETSINMSLSTPDPSFKKAKRIIKKNVRLSGYDNQTGPFYIDPCLLEKIHNPEKGMKIVKNYTSLMRGLHDVRRRVKVNATTFDEEFVGEKPYFHRLATEFDNHYINEIRYRPQVKKFCVKTDIIKIREMTRKKFLLHFMQEDLMNLFAKQDVENKMINSTNKFVKLCDPQFKKIEDEFYQKAKEKLLMVKPVSQETADLRVALTNKKDKLDLLMQQLMFSERKWETIMMKQNYYFMLMVPLWRLENDWIHRNKAGQLDMLKKSVVYCKKIHIRYKTKEISLHAIKRFFESTIEPKLDNMRKVTPDAVLLRNSLNNLKSNLMGILNKHNEIMLSHAEISYQQQQLENLVPNVCATYQKNMKIIQNKVKFIVERKEFLIKEVESVSSNPLMKSVKNVFIRKIGAISNHLCKSLFPDTFDESVRKYTTIENFCFISNHAMQLLSDLDRLPTYILHMAETEARNYRRSKLRVARMAMNEQNLFNMLQKQLKNHFTRTPKTRRRKSKGKAKSKRS